MSDFTPGQRWISDGETELGLGTILSVDARSVTVLFTASQETRTYSARQAPLTRVIFAAGDRIVDAEGHTLTVSDVEIDAGCIVYHGHDEQGAPATLPEARLSDSMRFHQAQDRLLTGQVDRNDWFELRYRSLHHHQRLSRSPALGLAGPRIDLIAHQLYIADEVSRRHAPRVLLADEVGLGKTIEAGLILHRLLLTGRASRALILVPPSLTHQWLIELLRRFSISVTLLDEAQSEAWGDDNPFDSGQCILASQAWLFANPQRQRQAEASQWDLMIVDEAHHLGRARSTASRLMDAPPVATGKTSRARRRGKVRMLARLMPRHPAARAGSGTACAPGDKQTFWQYSLSFYAALYCQLLRKLLCILRI